MDGSIRRVNDSVSIQPPARRRREDKGGAGGRFRIGDERSDDSSDDPDDDVADPQPHASAPDEILPIGRPSHDEAGVRVDLTA